MKRVAVLGAGFVSKPAVDYFIDRCGYKVLVTSLVKSEAERLIGNRPEGRALALNIANGDLLDQIVGDADLVLSMVPPAMHLPVAKACVKHHKPMVTTSYVTPQMVALDATCRQRQILILNEIGEDPGLDNMNTKRLIDHTREAGGQVVQVHSFGAGLPAFEDNDNPMGYKFSWSPMGVIMAAQSPAAYIEKGRVVHVPGTELFHHCRRVTIEGVGTFETYPNRDCTQYLDGLGLPDDISFFRGILRYPGWCRTMRGLATLQMFDTTVAREFSDTTYAEFTGRCIGAKHSDDIVASTAWFLDAEIDSSFIERLKWLGFFEDQQVATTKGTNADVLVDMMVRKMSYAPQEKDMVIIHNELLATFPYGQEKRAATLLVKGDPNGDSAMSRAVSLPAAIASRLILEGKITIKGVRRPIHKTIYQPVLEEMHTFGFRFNDTITST